MKNCSRELVRRLVATNFLMQTGNEAAYFVGMIGSATYILGADAPQIAVLVACISLTNVLGNGIAGVPIDVFGPRKVLMVSLAGYAACLLAGALIPLSYLSLLAICTISALFFGGATTAIAAFPAYLVSEREALKNANSLVDTAVHAAIIVGPAIGGLIATAFETRFVFLFGFIMLAVSAGVSWTILECLVPERQESLPQGEKNFLGDFSEGLAHLMESSELKTIFIMGFFGFFAYGAFDSLESLYYRDVLLVGVAWMGWLSMLSGVGSVIGSAILLKMDERRINLSILAIMLFITGVGTMLYVGTDQLMWAALGQTLCGFGFGLMMPVQHLLIQDYCDIAYLGRVSGVMRIGLNSSGLIPLAISPFLAGVFGVQQVLFTAASIVSVVGIGFIVKTQRSAQAEA